MQSHPRRRRNHNPILLAAFRKQRNFVQPESAHTRDKPDCQKRQSTERSYRFRRCLPKPRIPLQIQSHTRRKFHLHQHPPHTLHCRPLQHLRPLHNHLPNHKFRRHPNPTRKCHHKRPKHPRCFLDSRSRLGAFHCIHTDKFHLGRCKSRNCHTTLHMDPRRHIHHRNQCLNHNFHHKYPKRRCKGNSCCNK